MSDLKQFKESINGKLNTPEKEKVEIPTYILDNVAKKYILREYQIEALKRFIYYWKNKKFYQEQINNSDIFNRNKNHLLFNIATGGGKTLLMACVMLYLHYEYGYNNFLFLSHLNSINTKTRDNFFNKSSSKYLFSNNIIVNEVNNFNFNWTVASGINLMINSYQGVSSLLRTVKENSFNLADIINEKLVILADESHHLNTTVETGIKGEKGGVWEYYVNKILNSNQDNILLEFSATIKWDKEEFREKYKDKCLYIYDLEQFYKDSYTKTISLLQRQTDFENLMFGAVVLNKYRETLFENEISTKIKPVVLFKSKSINESLENHKKFNSLIANLDMNYINDFQNNLDSNSPTKIALNYLLKNFNENLVEILKNDFTETTIINTNREEEIENNAVLLNTLENKDNKKRVIFTVDKLNEGWDVLNLFDIVKLYSTNTVAETTQEAQLLGRGARYCPFNYGNGEFYRRKFEESEPLGILEQLFFHSTQDNMAIAKLKQQLENSGIVLKPIEKVEINRKPQVLNRIKDKLIFFNSRKEKLLIENSDYDIYEDIKKLSNKIIYTLNSSREITFNLMDKQEIINKEFLKENDLTEISFDKIDFYIKKNAFINNSSYNFNDLYDKLKINSFNDLIELLDNYSVAVKNYVKDCKNDYNIYSHFLNDVYNKIISKEIKKYVGTTVFKPDFVKKIFKDKILNKRDDRQEFTDNLEYYLYENSQLTSEEISFIKFFNLKIYQKLKERFTDIYLIRNERDLKLYNFEDATGFEPDFILLLKDNNNKEYNIYIEPKGDQLLENDKWKNEFLKQIKILTKQNKIKVEFEEKNDKGEVIKFFENDNYKILGFEFYNENIENSTDRMKKEFENL